MDLITRLSRRAVLKGMAAITSCAALLGCSVNDGGDIVYAEGGNNTDPVFQEEHTVSSVCRNNCTSGCHINTHVRGGRVVKTSKGSMKRVDDPNYTAAEGALDSQYDRICLRGLSHAQRMYHPGRIITPLIQRSRENRNKGDISTFEAVSWDEAVTYLATKLWNIYNSGATGNQKITSVYGTGNYGFYNSGSGLTGRLFNLLGAGSVSGAFDMALFYGIQKVVGLDKAPYFTGNEGADLINADLIFTWGNNFTETSSSLWHFLADAIENGSQHVNVDVRHTTTSAKADYFITVNPGSDAVLLMAMIQEVIAKKMMDLEFMVKHTVAPFFVNPNTLSLVRAKELNSTDAAINYVGWNNNTDAIEATRPDAVNGKATFTTVNMDIDREETLLINGSPVLCKTAFRMLKERVQTYTPELAEKYTGVKPETTRELAEMYAGDNINNIGGGKKVTVCPLFGPDHYYNGMQFYHALLTMASITGKIGKEGCSVGTFVPYAFLRSTTVAAATPLNGKSAGATVATVYYADAIKNQMFKGLPYDSKAMYVACCNPVSAYSDQKRMWIDTIIPHMEVIAVADLELTDTARHADVVFPACHWFECEDLVATGSHPFVMKQDKAVNTLGQSLPDSAIARLIAEKLEEVSGGVLAMSSYFNNTDEAYLRSQIKPDAGVYMPGSAGNPNPLNVTYDMVNKHKVVRYIPSRPNNKPYIFGEDGYYSTPSKRLEFYAEPANLGVALAAGSYGWIKNEDKVEFTGDFVKQQVLPDWIEPDEVWTGYSPDPSRFNALRAEYPYQMYQEHTRWRVHTQWFNVEWLREMDPYPTVQMNPSDAYAKGLNAGDMVKVYNSRGHVVLRLAINNGLPAGMVNVPKGWQRHQVAEHGGSGGYSELTNPKVHRALCNQPFFDVLVNVVKA